MPEKKRGKQTIDVLLEERRYFEPSPEFSAQANIADQGIYEKARKDPDKFWAAFAEELDWFKKWDKVLDWDPPDARWFVGGKINASYNCVDRHVKKRPAQQGGDHLGGRTWRTPYIDLLGPLPRGEQIRQCA